MEERWLQRTANRICAKSNSTSLEVKIFDVTGKVISEANDINKNIFVFNTEYFTKGLYFYKLYNNRKKAIGTGKFFIQ